MFKFIHTKALAILHTLILLVFIANAQVITLSKLNGKKIKEFEKGSFFILRHKKVNVIEFNKTLIDTANQIEVYGFLNKITPNMISLNHVYEESYFKNTTLIDQHQISEKELLHIPDIAFQRNIHTKDITTIILEYPKTQKLGSNLMDIGMVAFFIAPFIALDFNTVSIHSDTYLWIAGPGMGLISSGLFLKKLYREKKFNVNLSEDSIIPPGYKPGIIRIE